MQEFRCHQCKHLLYTAKGEVDSEVICNKCRRINYPSRRPNEIGLRGREFQSKAKDLNCPACKRLLFRAITSGNVIIETKCKYHKKDELGLITYTIDEENNFNVTVKRKDSITKKGTFN